MFLAGYSRALSKYATFTGRSDKREFLGFMLVFITGVIGAGLYDRYAQVEIRDGKIILLATMVWMIINFIPLFSVTARRLRDIGRSGWWSLLVTIPYLNLLMVILLLIIRSKHPASELAPLPLDI